MTTGAIPTDVFGFYAADLGITYVIPLTTTTAHSIKLPPGRYLVQIMDLAGTSRGWAAARPYKAGRGNDMTAGAPYFPFDVNSSVRHREIQVKPGVNDQISAILGAGTGNLYISCIERSVAAKKARLG